MVLLAKKNINTIANKITIRGIIQGVGFRPFVYKIASKYSCTGWVRNTGSSVEILIEGTATNIKGFLTELTTKSPPAALIRDFVRAEVKPPGYTTFIIKESRNQKEPISISPDLALCPQCLKEFNDPANRRFKYPFINCTHCGPRFTIIQGIPYDRCKTTMSSFTMCPQCLEEYANPLDRRFHAQPNACQNCGPSLKLLDKYGQPCTENYCSLLLQGYIMAVKSLGGFHLVCDATNEKVVETLRERKNREAKPLAVMAKNLKILHKHCYVSPQEKNLLQSPQAPIVILKQKKATALPASLSPNLDTLGVMLPYTPLHHLLFDDNLELLVMTSGNRSGEPLIYNNHEAIQKLAGIADFFLLHNRPIYNRCDDSVIRVIRGTPQITRRARGFVPLPLSISPVPTDLLALGADLKNTFCLASSNKAFLSQHLGDLENYNTFLAYKKNLQHFQEYFQIKPTTLVHDLHPGYLTTQYANSLALPKIGVQHHQAHLSSCLAENNFTKEVLGLVCDGSGYGLDHHIWGFEFFSGSIGNFQRLAHLEYVPLLGGETTIQKSERMALIYLLTYCQKEGIKWVEKYLQLPPGQIALYEKLLKDSHNYVLTSSCGRLFDAVAALLGVCRTNKYEGQGPMELEALCQTDISKSYPFTISEDNTLKILSLAEMWPQIINDMERKKEPGYIAAKFHQTLVKMISKTFLILREETGLNTVALSGGTMQNMYLLHHLLETLREKGFIVLTHHKVPPNDGGISLGQAVTAGRLLSCV